jgi:hypothetical protein
VSIIKSYIEGNATKLNALKYNGSSPIITKEIPTTVDQKGHNSNQITARIDDLTRFTKLFTKPQGLKYLTNDALLSKVGNESKYKDKTFVGKILAKVKDKAVSAVKLTASTLAQVPVNGTGTHFVRGFNGKVYKGPDSIPFQLGEKDILRKADKKFDTIKPPIESFNDIDNIQANIVNNFGLPKVLSVQEENIEKLSSYFTKPTKAQIDSLNVIPPVKDSTFLTLGDSKDIINFNFKILGPEEESQPVTLYFRALLESFDDNYGANWGSTQYVGRAEPFNTYQGFTRSISLSFKIAAMTRAEMNPLYQKIIQLASTTAPTYSQDGFMRGTITKLTVGDYLVNQPGFISSVNYSWDKSYQWEIKLKDSAEAQGVDQDVQQLPMILDVNLQFEPIHTFAPQTGTQPYFTNNVEDPFIQEGVNELASEGIAIPTADTSGLNDLVSKGSRLNPLTKREQRKQKRLERKVKRGRLSLEEYRKRGGI